MNTPDPDERFVPAGLEHQTVSQLILTAGQRLADAGIPEPRREAASLMGFALQRDRSFLIAHPEHVPSSGEKSLFFEAVARREMREPFHYITGLKEFFGLDFEVSPAVLIPRPETEKIVELAIEEFTGEGGSRFCEVGVGSGCISIAILANRQKATAVGLEISADAIEVARRNAARHAVGERFEIRSSDIFSSLADDERFDLIVSNPPYVPSTDIAGLQPEVRDHEPAAALTDGSDGLSIIRRIVAESPKHLVPGGGLVFEIGIGQDEAVSAMLDNPVWRQTLIHKDLQGIPRIAAARLRR